MPVGFGGYTFGSEQELLRFLKNKYSEHLLEIGRMEHPPFSNYSQGTAVELLLVMKQHLLHQYKNFDFDAWQESWGHDGVVHPGKELMDRLDDAIKNAKDYIEEKQAAPTTTIDEIAKYVHTRIAANNGFFDEQYFVMCIGDGIATALKEAVPDDSMVITKKEYDSLREDSVWLGYLNAAGVDNWRGYGHAAELQEEDNNG